LQRGNLELGSGLLRFRSKDQAREYMEQLLDYYKLRSEEYGGQMGELLRADQPKGEEGREPKEGKAPKDAKLAAKGWLKMGSLPVNSSDPQKAMAEVTLKIVEEYKLKVERTTEALKSLDEIEAHNSASANLVFYISRGVPEAVIVEPGAPKLETFAFSGSFRAV
jgi:hypothetical protein